MKNRSIFWSSFSVKVIFTGIPNVDACITGNSGQLKPSTVSYTHICNSLPITVFLFWTSQPFPALSVFRFYTHLPFHICFFPPFFFLSLSFLVPPCIFIFSVSIWSFSVLTMHKKSRVTTVYVCFLLVYRF